MTFPAGISRTEVRHMEREAISDELARKRRTTLVCMSSDSKTLQSRLQDAPERFQEMVRDVEDYERHTDRHHQLARSALARLALVGQADMLEE